MKAWLRDWAIDLSNEFIFFRQPFRRWLIRFSVRYPGPDWWNRWLTDRLIPSGSMVTFAEEDEA